MQHCIQVMYTSADMSLPLNVAYVQVPDTMTTSADPKKPINAAEIPLVLPDGRLVTLSIKHGEMLTHLMDGNRASTIFPLHHPIPSHTKLTTRRAAGRDHLPARPGIR